MSLLNMGGIARIFEHLNFAERRGEKDTVNLAALMSDDKTARVVAGSSSVLKSLSD